MEKTCKNCSFNPENIGKVYCEYYIRCTVPFPDTGAGNYWIDKDE